MLDYDRAKRVFEKWLREQFPLYSAEGYEVPEDKANVTMLHVTLSHPTPRYNCVVLVHFSGPKVIRVIQEDMGHIFKGDK